MSWKAILWIIILRAKAGIMNAISNTMAVFADMIRQTKPIVFMLTIRTGSTVKATVEQNLQKEDNKIYGMMTHTCPIDYLTTEMFMSTRQNACIKRKPRMAKSKKLFKPDIDRSTEIRLGELEKKLDYEVWFCGHYHVDKQLGKVQMMYKNMQPLHMQLFGDE